MKLNAAFIWVGAVFISSIAVFVYLVKSDGVNIQSQLAISRYANDAELNEVLAENLSESIQQNNSYWIGIEPGKTEQIPLIVGFLAKLKEQHSIAHVIVDYELRLSKEQLESLNPSDVISLKEHLYDIAEKLQKLEQEKVSYVLITAAIYSTSILDRNPLDIMKKQFALSPMTLSLSYLPLKTEDERDMVFPCKTADDHTGTALWGCNIVNKVRIVRKQIVPDTEKPWTAFLDRSGPSDFILVLNKDY